MGRTERLYKIQRLLNSGQAVTMARFLEALEISKATFKRDLEYLRDRLGAPIVWDPEASGYRLEISADERIHPLPGLWLNEAEIYALLTGIEMLVTEFQSQPIQILHHKVLHLVLLGEAVALT